MAMKIRLPRRRHEKRAAPRVYQHRRHRPSGLPRERAASSRSWGIYKPPCWGQGQTRRRTSRNRPSTAPASAPTRAPQPTPTVVARFLEAAGLLEERKTRSNPNKAVPGQEGPSHPSRGEGKPRAAASRRKPLAAPRRAHVQRPPANGTRPEVNRTCACRAALCPDWQAEPGHDGPGLRRCHRAERPSGSGGRGAA